MFFTSWLGVCMCVCVCVCVCVRARVVSWSVDIEKGTLSLMDRVSSVGTATYYGLDGPGIESRWGTRFSSPDQTDPGEHPASCKNGY